MTAQKVTRPPKALPVTEDLPFTLADIRSAIPRELFHFSMSKSWWYIARDVVQLAVPVVLMWWLLPLISSPVLRAAAWLVYAFVQGTTSFGLWVIGHECGHQAYFGHHRLLNDAVGFVIHSLYLAPYFSWKFTHATHHRYTNLKSKDTVYVPTGAAGYWWEIGEAFPPIHIALIAVYALFGWTGYILTYYEGQPSVGVPNSHFNPWSRIFAPSERFYVMLSTCGVGAVLAGVAAVSYVWGFSSVACWYLGPVVATYGWLVIVTFLQHTDSSLPHYDDGDNWNFVKGALCTVDRDYGVFNAWMHHITNGHVVHHLFSRMPFYNAIEATPYVKERCGEHYKHDARPLWQQLWQSWWVHQSGHLHVRKHLSQ